jgi:hypothetical protein
LWVENKIKNKENKATVNALYNDNKNIFPFNRGCLILKKYSNFKTLNRPLNWQQIANIAQSLKSLLRQKKHAKSPCIQILIFLIKHVILFFIYIL